MHNLKNFGATLATEGSTLLIGGLRRTPYSLFDRPVVYQFEWDSTTENWQEVRVLCGSDTNAEDSLGLNFEFGRGVAVAGEQILIGDPFTENTGTLDSGSAYFFDRTLPAAEIVDPFVVYQARLDHAVPDLAAPEDDADGDGQANLLEFFGGTDALQASTQNHARLEMVAGDVGVAQILFKFHERKLTAGLRPSFYFSHTLAAESWRRIDEPQYEVDVDMGAYRIRSLDLTNEVVDGLPLFIKMMLEHP